MREHYIFLLDTSYSMQPYIAKIIEGINNFIKKLKSLNNGDIYISLIYFNTNITYLFRCANIKNIDAINSNIFINYGTTALYDSVCDVLINYDVSGLKNNFYIITDGDDNASKRYTKEKADELCNRATTSGDWNIIHFHTDNILNFLNTATNILYNPEDDLSNIFDNLSI